MTDLSQAVAALQAGRPDQALPVLQAAVKARPAAVEPRFYLAVALQGVGDVAGAQAAYEKVLKRDPRLVPALNNLGGLRHGQGDVEAARKLFVKAARAAPDDPTGHMNLGNALLSLGRAGDACGALEKAAALAPRDARIWYNLANAYQAARRHLKAEAAYDQALALAPEVPDIHNNAGLFHMHSGRPRRGAEHFATAARLAPDNPGFAANRVRALLLAEDLPAARAACDDLAARFPDLAEGALLRGDLLQREGDFPAARVAYETVLAREPQRTAAFRGLTSAGRVPPGDPLLDRMRAAAQQPDLDPAARVELGFALAKALDDVGAHGEAAVFLAEANALVDAGYAGRHRDYAAMVTALERTFTPELFQRKATIGHDSRLPVLIVGLPRSGTTLTEQILAAHPQAAGAGELSLLPYFVDDLPDLLGVADPWPQVVEHLEAGTVTTFAEQTYLPGLRAASASAARIADKAPNNFWRLGLFALLFPHGRIIHCRRNVMDTALSIFFQNFSGHHDYAYNLERLGAYIRAYRRIMAHWHRVLPQPILDFDYETTVAEPEAQARALLTHVDLPWDPAVLRFHSVERAVATASKWQVRQPLYQRSVDRWRRYESLLAPLLPLLEEG